MRLKTRIHEWLADRIDWVQYPRLVLVHRQPHRTLSYRWSVMTWKQRGWVLFFAWWGAVCALSIYGNLID